MITPQRLLETYRRLKTYPVVAEAVLKDGHEIWHEIGNRGYLKEYPDKTRVAQREWLERVLDRKQRICAQISQAYRAPVYIITQEIVGLMNEHGMRYNRSMTADDIPVVWKPRKALFTSGPCTGATTTGPLPPITMRLDILCPWRTARIGSVGFRPNGMTDMNKTDIRLMRLAYNQAKV